MAAAGVAPGPARGRQLSELGIVEHGAVAVRGERVVWVGPETEIEHAVPIGADTRRVDAAGGVVLPGFVDPHTHLLFAGTRVREFEERVRGVPYLEIARRGGGILSSVRAFRAASDRQLLEAARRRLERILLLGTTTIEVKTGYGLETAQELRALELIRQLDEEQPIDLVPTFLGAHAVPPEYDRRTRDYVDLVIEEMMPAVTDQGIARFCDVFCEPGYFDREESRRVLTAAREHGLSLKLHADEFEDHGGAALAAELGAVSADHLMAIGEEGVRRLAGSATIPVLLPGTSFFLGMKRFAPGRRLADSGLPLALATDLNPGSSHVASMPLITSLGCLGLGLTPAETLVAATRNAAHAAGVGEDRGWIGPGALADLQILDLPAAVELPYQIGAALVDGVVKRGRVVIEAGRPATPSSVRPLPG